MDVISLEQVTDELGRTAADVDAGRAARTLLGGAHAVLRQTVIALTAGSRMSEHASPGEATLLVLSGRVRMTCGEKAGEAGAHEMIVIPDALHALEALEDSAVLLTVAKPEAAEGADQG